MASRLLLTGFCSVVNSMPIRCASESVGRLVSFMNDCMLSVFS